ncbi:MULTISPECIES: hypothetical protein [Sphingobacterium]|uniref:hypothetical protein n=1 Tax=Sphingobacterium TaxID=28453 RepID=UPI002580A278|nr:MULTISPECIES: hypothetical protein [Sphingobacterium]
MKLKFIASLLAFVPTFVCAQSGDPNIELSLDAPAYGVNIRANFPGGNGIWARGYRVSNQTGAENFIQFGSYGNTTNGVSKAVYSFIGRGYDQTFMAFLPEGNIGIGTITPKEKLSVNGKIRAHEVKVETSNWPDYVFEEDYKLPSLTELETYLKANKHLPEIPTAQEVESKGIQVGDMINKLLKKNEELTLHAIENEKKRLALEDKVSQLEKLILTISAQNK